MLPPNKKLAVRLRLKKNDQRLTSRTKDEHRGEVCQILHKQNATLQANVNKVATLTKNPIDMQYLIKYLELSETKKVASLGQGKAFCQILRKVRIILKSLLAQAIIISSISSNNNIAKQNSNITEEAVKEEFERSLQKFTTGLSKEINRLNQTKKNRNHKNLKVKSSSEQTSEQQSDYERLVRQNEELKHQTSQMEHYIISLKELLNERERNIQELLGENKSQQEELNQVKELLQKMENECKILRQEVAGYEQKFQQLELRRQVQQKSESSQRESSSSNSKKVKPFEQSMQVENNFKESLELKQGVNSNNLKPVEKVLEKQQIDLKKLEIIYQKTEKLLKKCKILQQQKAEKEKECSVLKNIIKQIVQSVGLLEEDQEFIMDEGIGKQIANQIMKKLNTQNTASQMSGERIEQSKLHEIAKSLEEIEQLLSKNEEDLGNYNIDVYEFIGLICSQEGIKEDKIYQYFDQLEERLKSLSTHKQNNIQQNYVKKNENLQVSLNEFVTNFQALIQHTQDIHQQSLTKVEGNVQSLYTEILSLSQKLKDIKNILDQKKEAEKCYIQLQKNVNKILTNEISRMKTKYYPTNPQFVQDMINKLMELRSIQKQQELLQVFDSIFSSLKAKDEHVKQQMGRKKEVVKQRSAAIAQICKKGMRESFLSQ